jgi:hypothetical protein
MWGCAQSPESCGTVSGSTPDLRRSREPAITSIKSDVNAADEFIVYDKYVAKNSIDVLNRA